MSGGVRKWLFLAALLLPILWSAGSWAVHQRAIGAGASWVIPVEGYDPRDLIRGQHIRFRYAWEVRGDGAQCGNQSCDLCLSREGDKVVAEIAPLGAQCRNRVDLRQSGIGVSQSFRQGAVFSSRIFVSESSAPQLDAMLRQGGVQVEATLTPEGRLVNRRLISAGTAAG